MTRFPLGLASFGVHHPVAALIVFAVLAAAVLFCKAVLGRHSQGWRRARSIRFHLWLRPGAGFASLPERRSITRSGVSSPRPRKRRR
jgi:hypothetical protein